MKYAVYLLALLAVALLASPLFVFTNDEREMSVVLRFGAPKHAYTEPGMYFKLPFADSVQTIPKVKQFWGDEMEELLPDLPTKDDKKIELIPWAIWRVNDPIVFVQRLRTMDVAERRVSQIVRSSIRDIVTQYELEEFVRSTDRALPVSELSAPSQGADAKAAALLAEQAVQSVQSKPSKITIGRGEILTRIKEEAQRRLASKKDDTDTGGRGIELIDVGISQSGFVSSVRQKTFDRWIAERQAISARNVNEGERLKQAIISESKAEVDRIEGEGQQKANEIKGKTDAEVIKMYADALQQTGEFYAFVRTLQAYENSIGPDSQLILSTSSPFFKVFSEMSSQVTPATR